MRKLIVVLIALSVIWSCVKLADACGDKTMRVGGGLRFLQLQASKNPSSILIHAGALPRENASRLRDFLKRVGHKANTFDNMDYFDEALKAGQYDVIITNLASAADVQKQVASLSPKTRVVPVTFKPTSEEAITIRQYKVFVKNPKYAEDFLPAINQVMNARSKKA